MLRRVTSLAGVVRRVKSGQSLVQGEDFDGVHAVRVPFGDRQQSAAATTTVDSLRILHWILIRQKVSHVPAGGVKHADSGTVVRHEDVAAQVDR